MDIREVTSDEQIEFIDKTREVLKAAVHSSLQIEQLKKMDRKRTQALAKLVEHMQMQRDALQLKLNDLGFKDTSEDDAIHEAMIAKKFHNANDGGKEEPVKTPSGKNFLRHANKKLLIRTPVWNSYLRRRRRRRRRRRKFRFRFREVEILYTYQNSKSSTAIEYLTTRIHLQHARRVNHACVACNNKLENAVLGYLFQQYSKHNMMPPFLMHSKIILILPLRCINDVRLNKINGNKLKYHE